ncbi:hypothetical protein ACMA1D_10660 [Streptomyces sp. 796.1]|uniref:hypothetical protein n=1 Tax=Streptomyces sp. 796.1 TaxID=3163029 RepID=UPI0039C97A62
MTDATYTFSIDWDDDGDFGDAGENVSARVLGLRQAVGFRSGRDEARALSAVAPGETSFELDNESGDYSPDNPGSPLAGRLTPGKRVLVQATHQGVTRDLFQGYVDDFELLPDRESRSVKLSVLDMLSKFREAQPSTALFRSVQTGAAIHALLDVMGWPASLRDIDAGATTIRWWWADGEDALTALAGIVEAEGPPAIAYVSGSGAFVFRDRHHRLTRPASTTVQATFRPVGLEPTFASPMTYDIGWRDLVNQVTVDVEERDPQPTQVVWETDEIFTLGTGESRTIVVRTDDPFIDAEAPEAGTDFTLVSGSVTTTVTRASGQTTWIEITASANSVIEGLRLRAKPVTVSRTLRVEAKDSASQDVHGVRTLQDAELRFASRNDADAIANVIIGQRAKRLPVVTITVNSGNDTRITQILDRALSDRIHVVEPEQTFVDHDFFIDQIEHDIAQVGLDHRVAFSCERAPESAGATPNYFTFDSPTADFDNGVFAEAGVSFSSEIFVLDDPTMGQLDNRGLGF